MKRVTEEWTIVIVGHWNTSIFNPQWLANNIFNEKQLGIEFPLEPGLPLKITGDKVLLIPRDDRVIIGATELTDAVVKRTEEIAVVLLKTLPHTPIRMVGINFGYMVKPISEDLRERFKNPYANAFADKKLNTLGKSFRWKCKIQDQIINIFFDDTLDKLLIKVNYHSETKGALAAKEAIEGKVMKWRAKTEEILEDIYDLTLEEEV